MAATAGHRLTLDHMRKCSNANNINFVEDLPMTIPEKFGFYCPSGFIEEALHECSLDGPLQTVRFLFRYEIQNSGYGRT
jgi:hypothetical protein